MSDKLELLRESDIMKLQGGEIPDSTPLQARNADAAYPAIRMNSPGAANYALAISCPNPAARKSVATNR
ncbi:MAG TPA: hypothetical protein VFJ52_02665, partial [Terriglobia bacterium]|nr:hypothetical protein [Terriglobia bacterium]